jgi:glycosyltransferase involved in cell wall biosynthesis
LKTTIAIACYNECSTISEVISQAKSLYIDKEIIIVDNCSTDGTREILQSVDDDLIRIILQPKNFGVGRSAQLLIKLADSDYFHGPGADLEYEMTDVFQMREKLEKNTLDAVFGSRLIGSKKSILQLIRERPFWLGTIVATFLINLIYNKRFTDVIGTKLIRTDVIKSLGCKADNQAFEFELVSRLCKNGYKIEEIPVYYKPRTAEEGKTIKWWDMIYAIKKILTVSLS